MDELLDEKIKVVLNLIRTNNSAADALNIAQAVNYLFRARESLNAESSTGTKSLRKQGSGS